MLQRRRHALIPVFTEVKHPSLALPRSIPLSRKRTAATPSWLLLTMAPQSLAARTLDAIVFSTSPLNILTFLLFNVNLIFFSVRPVIHLDCHDRSVTESTTFRFTREEGNLPDKGQSPGRRSLSLTASPQGPLSNCYRVCLPVSRSLLLSSPLYTLYFFPGPLVFE